MDSKNIEFGNLPFNEEQKNFVRKYAYWLDSPEDTKALIKEMAKAMEKFTVGRH